MKWFRVLSLSCFGAIVLGCGGFGFVYEKRLVGDLGLVACDTMAQMAVTDFTPGGSGHLIPDTVFAVGWDQTHIIAKRHPREDFRVDKSRTEYYIVVVRARKAYGPFDRAEFALHCDLLGVAEGLNFTLTFHELE
jgi:hypothetical protein